MQDRIRKFDFGPLGNRIVMALGVVLACALLLLSALLVSRVAGLAHDVWRARDWTSVQASILHASMSSAREPRKLGYYETRDRKSTRLNSSH